MAITGAGGVRPPGPDVSGGGHVSVVDGGSLTLAGIIYAALVTVAGVAVALHNTWRCTLIYAAVSLGLLAVGVVWPGPVLLAMRWLIVRAETQARAATARKARRRAGRS